MAKKEVEKTTWQKVRPLVSVGFNTFFWPGLGTLISGRTKIGIIQMVLGVISVPLMLILIGFPLLFGVWIWALVSSIKILKEEL